MTGVDENMTDTLLDREIKTNNWRKRVNSMEGKNAH